MHWQFNIVLGGQEKNFVEVFKIGTFFPEFEQKVLFSDDFILHNRENEPYFLVSVRSSPPSLVSSFSNVLWKPSVLDSKAVPSCHDFSFPATMIFLSSFVPFHQALSYFFFKYFISTHSLGHMPYTNPPERSPLVFPVQRLTLTSSTILVNHLASKSIFLLQSIFLLFNFSNEHGFSPYLTYTILTKQQTSLEF